MDVPVVVPPRTRDELHGALAKLHQESAAYWQAFDDASFFRAFGQAWSPAETVRHLTKSIRPVARALRVPRLLLWLRFGRAGEGRSYERMCAIYDAALAAGGKAGPFAPSPEPPDGDPQARRAAIVSAHDDVARQLREAVAAWPETQLDRRCLPHPLLGKLSVREMLFFTLYHNLHHVQVAERHRAEVSSS